MDQENLKSLVYDNICVCVLDILDAVNEFLSTASPEEIKKWPQFLPLAHRLVATIEIGKQLKNYKQE